MEKKWRGISDYLGISDEIDIIEGTLAKAYGVMGRIYYRKQIHR